MWCVGRPLQARRVEGLGRFAILVAVFVLFVATRSFTIIGQAEVMVIERLGRFHRRARSGFNARTRAVDVQYVGPTSPGRGRSRPAPPPASIGASRCSTFPSPPVIYALET